MSPRILTLLLSGCLAGSIQAEGLHIQPDHILSDETASITADGLQAGEQVSIEAVLTDGDQRQWAAEATFVADDYGVVDLMKQIPVHGSYKLLSPMGLIWSMRPTDRKVTVYTPPRGLSPQEIEFRLFRDGKQACKETLLQEHLRPDVKRVKVDGLIRGVLFVPDTPGPHAGVLVLGGSEGGTPVRKAAWLASHGFAALALAYFHTDGLPDKLESIPLEYFGQALSWLMHRDGVDGDRIGVLGTSRGGELALQLGSMYPQVKAVVAYVPANVRYPACCGSGPAPAWTWKKTPLAYLPTRASGDPHLVQQATIHVENMRGPVFLISGGKDGVWDSEKMSDAVIVRLQLAKFPFPFEHVNYPEAGHTAGMPEILPTWNDAIKTQNYGPSLTMGGSPEGNALSSLDAIPKVLMFLKKSLANGQNGALITENPPTPSANDAPHSVP